jgi:predicted GNAT superfamily acetyltransferase
MAGGKLETTFENGGRTFLLRVEDSAAAADYQKYEDLRNTVWGFPEDRLAGTRNMMCENFLHEGSSLFIGAFVADEAGRFPREAASLAGFCYGFVGVRDKSRGFRDPANLWFYAQYLGVRPEFQSFGLGVRLKEFQREALLEHYGVTQVVCTFDPLTAVNAQRNIRHFGMEVVEYRVATYGEYGGLLNRLDVPTDRLFMSWDLTRPPGTRAAVSVPAGTPRLFQVRTERVSGTSGETDVEVAGEPDLSLGTASLGTSSVGAEVLLLPVPRDFYALLRETNVADPAVRGIPLDWRLKTRRALLDLLGRGYRIADFRRAENPPFDPAYILKRV